MDAQERGRQLARDVILARLIIELALSEPSPVRWTELTQEDVRSTIEEAGV